MLDAGLAGSQGKELMLDSGYWSDGAHTDEHRVTRVWMEDFIRFLVYHFGGENRTFLTKEIRAKFGDIWCRKRGKH